MPFGPNEQTKEHGFNVTERSHPLLYKALKCAEEILKNKYKSRKDLLLDKLCFVLVMNSYHEYIALQDTELPSYIVEAKNILAKAMKHYLDAEVKFSEDSKAPS